MALFDTFQARVGRDQGATRMFIAETGYFNVGDKLGSTDGTDITGAQLQAMLMGPLTRTSCPLSTNSVLAVNSVIPASYGYVAIVQGANPSTCSLRLPSAKLYHRLFIDFRHWQSDISVLVGNAASLVLGNTLSDMSCIMMVNGSVNSAWVELTCFTDGQWAVTNMSDRTGVSPQASS